MDVNLSPAQAGYLFGLVKDERNDIKYVLLKSIRLWHEQNKKTMIAGMAQDLLESYCTEWDIPLLEVLDKDLFTLPF